MKTSTQAREALGLKAYETTVYYDRLYEEWTVRYHGNIIAFVYPKKKTVTITNSGWFTKTTKDRLNRILDAFRIPIGIYQKDWNWYFYDGHKDTRYHDGCTFAYTYDPLED